MTTPLDLDLVPAARELLDEFGAVSTLRSVTEGTYDPATGEYTGGSVDDFEVKGSPPSPLPIGFVGVESGTGESVTTLTREDVIAFMAADGAPATPERGDRFAIGSPPALPTDPLPEPSFQVVAVDTLYSGDQVAAYKLVMRP